MRWLMGWMLACGCCAPALAWGDLAHQVIALIAEQQLEPAVRRRVNELLRGDNSGLAPTDMAQQATWADRWRDSDRLTTQQRFVQTREWHYVNIRLADRDLVSACGGRPPLPPGVPPSEGPAKACIVDKIDQFITALRDRRHAPAERRLALQFLLHLVGDLHQPLHVGDDGDRGGNGKRVAWPGMPPGMVNLHRVWDVEVVQALGTNPRTVARALLAGIRPADKARWSAATPSDWAMETFAVARDRAYAGLPPPDANGVYTLSAAYVDRAGGAAALQLSRAGVRLARVLNGALR